MRINMKSLAFELESQGWKVKQTNNGHWRFIPPDPSKNIVIASSTPSCAYAMKNILSDLKRNGFRKEA